MDFLILLLAIFLIVIGVPVGLSLMGAAIVGFIFTAPIQLQAIANVAVNSVNDPTLVAIPLFVLAGAVIAESGFMDSLLEVLAWILRPLRGGLILSAVNTALFFAGATGSTAGESASLAGSFFKPMSRRGYSEPLTAATISAACAAGVLIPPSITLIIYGTVANYPVTSLWLAGVVPALMTGVLLGLVGVLRARRGLKRNPVAAESPLIKSQKLLITVIKSIAAIGLPIFVMAGVYSGVFTITETAAIAIVYVLAFGLIFNRMGFRRMYRCFNIGAERAALIFMVFISAHVFTYYLQLSGVITSTVTGVTNSGLPRPVLLILLDLVILALGSIMDGLGVLLVATPIIFPLLGVLGLNPVQLGVMLCLAIEIGVIHPPIGLNLFAVSSVTDVPVGRIAIAVLPYIAVLLFMLGLVTFAHLPIFQWG
jgi:C4-dicarboxylate transporter, DctM subunit